MNNEQNKLDQLYQQTYKDFSMPMSDKVLAKIKKELKPNKGKKGGYWLWSLGAVLLMMGVAGAYYFWLTHTSSNTAPQAITKPATVNHTISIIAKKQNRAKE